MLMMDACTRESASAFIENKKPIHAGKWTSKKTIYSICIHHILKRQLNAVAGRTSVFFFLRSDVRWPLTKSCQNSLHIVVVRAVVVRALA